MEFVAQAEHQLAFGAFTQEQYEQLTSEEYEIATLAAYTAPAATVEEFKAHINTARLLPGGPGLLFKGQRDAPQAKAKFDFKGAKDKKPWQTDKRPISDEIGSSNKVLPYKCKGCGKFAHYFATGNFKDFTVATKCDQGDCRHPWHDGTAMMAKKAKTTVSQPITSQSIEASIAKVVTPIHEALQRNNKPAEAAYAGIEAFVANEFGLSHHKAYGAMHIGKIAEEQQPEDKSGDTSGKPNPAAHLHTGLKRSKGLEQTETGVTWLISACYLSTVLLFVMGILSGIDTAAIKDYCNAVTQARMA